jgi:cell division septal protein FtsQ
MLLSIAKKTKFFFILFALLSLTTFNLNLSNFNIPFFQIKEVYFNKTKYFQEEIKFNVYEHLINKNLFFLDKINIKKKILLSKWVKEVKFKKQFPNKLFLEILEYYPIAYFSENNKFVYLNNNFEMINSNKYLTDSQLVKVTSYNGIVSFKNLFQELVKFENILLKTKEVQMIAPKRWNLLLNNGVLVKLGYEDKYKQFQILENIIKDKKNFIIDLRNINKIYITHNND